jgi:hypothetical protein
MTEPSVHSMLQWISRKYRMSESDLARMFQKDDITINSWLSTGKIAPVDGGLIRSSFYYFNNRKALPNASRGPTELFFL